MLGIGGCFFIQISCTVGNLKVKIGESQGKGI